MGQYQSHNSAKLKLDYTYTDSTDFIDDSDHYLFYKNDIPIVHLTSGKNHTDRHKSTDDPEKIDFELIRDVSILTYNLIMEVANQQESLRGK